MDESKQILDEAWTRLHRTGAEFDDGLSNHGPMVVEAMVKSGRQSDVHGWLDTYVTRLEEPARPGPVITDWRDALGDRSRTVDWAAFFHNKTAEQPWRDVLVAWWPRLVDGLVGAAGHGVIRVGHAVRALREHGESPVRLKEFGHAMGYFAAAYHPLPKLAAAAGARGPRTALDKIPTIPDEHAGHVLRRLDWLGAWDEWTVPVAEIRTPENTREDLDALVHAAALAYLRREHRSSVMLVHAVTTPNAVARVLPELPEELWAQSYAAAWAATAALTSLYTRTGEVPVQESKPNPDEAVTRAVEHGDEHAIKLADTTLDIFARTGDGDALAAAQRSVVEIETMPWR
jgi:hypothetical protein